MTWEIDASHSEVLFSVRHLAISTVKGHFTVLGGTLHIDEENPSNSWVDAEVDVASINTRDANRDAHLRSADFFDAEKYPKITFKSTNVEHLQGHNYRVTGDLTIHGITNSITFDAQYGGQLKDPYGLQRAGLNARTTISRKDFGLTWNAVVETTGGLVVSDEVKIEIELEAINK